MPRDGSGNYSLPTGNPVVPNTIISSGGWANPTLTDIAAAITQSLSKDGQTTPTANLPMGNYRHLNVANAANRTDYAAAGQVQDSILQLLTSVSGTDTITTSLVPAIIAYATGQTFRFVSAGANTSNTVTLNINGLGAKAITKNGATALAPGDIPAGAIVDVSYDGTQFQVKSVAAPSSGPNSSPFSWRNKLINAQGNANQEVYVSGTATSASNQYTLDMMRVVVSGQNLAFAASGNHQVMTAPAGGVDLPVEATIVEGGNYYLNWLGTATATINGTAVAKGGFVNVAANTAITVRFIGGTYEMPQLELGGVTPFEFRPPEIELALCQRYLFKTMAQAVKPQNQPAGGNSGALVCCLTTAAGFYAGECTYPVVMRIAGTVTFYAPQSVGNNVWTNGGNTLGSTPNLSAQNDRKVSVFMNSGSSFTPSGVDVFYIHLKVDARL